MNVLHICSQDLPTLKYLHDKYFSKSMRRVFIPQPVITIKPRQIGIIDFKVSVWANTLHLNEDRELSEDIRPTGVPYTVEYEELLSDCPLFGGGVSTHHFFSAPIIKRTYNTSDKDYVLLPEGGIYIHLNDFDEFTVFVYFEERVTVDGKSERRLTPFDEKLLVDGKYAPLDEGKFNEEIITNPMDIERNMDGFELTEKNDKRVKLMDSFLLLLEAGKVYNMTAVMFYLLMASDWKIAKAAIKNNKYFEVYMLWQKLTFNHPTITATRRQMFIKNLWLGVSKGLKYYNETLAFIKNNSEPLTFIESSKKTPIPKTRETWI